MTSTTQVLEIAPITNKSGLKSCTPNLMPFHIDYSGKAPISTYLRVEAAPVAEDKDASEEAKQGEGNEEKGAEPNPGLDEKPATVEAIPDAPARFVSTFRGRKIQGLDVKLPEGYTGVVLKAPGTGNDTPVVDEPRSKPKAKKNSNSTRRTRNSGFVYDVDENVEEYDEAMDVDSPTIPEDDDLERKDTRTLVPTSQFSSITLWHPDFPVDEGKDEYYRSLLEWTRLAAEIHRAD